MKNLVVILNNHLTGEEIDLVVSPEKQDFLEVLTTIRETYPASDWGVFEAWRIDGGLNEKAD